MSLFQSILSSLQARISSNEIQYKEITRILSENSGVTVTPQDIKVQHGVLKVALPPTAKMALLLKRENLLQLFKEQKIPIVSIV